MAILPSKTGICNLALKRIGANAVTSIDTDDSNEARILVYLYDFVRRALLRSHPWNFAGKRQALSRLSTTPAFEYSYEYSLPDDCIRVMNLYDSSEKFVIEGRKLLTDETTVNLRYIYDVTIEAYFDPLFVEVFALALAYRLSYNISGNSTVTQEIKLQLDEQMRIAKMVDGTEGRFLQVSSGDWLTEFDDAP